MNNVTRFEPRRHIRLESRASGGDTGPLEEGERKGEEIDKRGHDENDHIQQTSRTDPIDIEQGGVDMEQGKCDLLISAQLIKHKKYLKDLPITPVKQHTVETHHGPAVNGVINAERNATDEDLGQHEHEAKDELVQHVKIGRRQFQLRIVQKIVNQTS